MKVTKAQQEKLDAIKPGVNYPSCVHITETKGKKMDVKFLLNSFMVGMYCAIHINGGSMPVQTGDHDNKKFVTGLKKDIFRAIKRGAKVEIDALYPCKLFPETKPLTSQPQVATLTV